MSDRDVSVAVDDIVIAGSDLAEVERVQADFKSQFEMKVLG